MAQFVSASLPSNKFKNRLANILPCMFLKYRVFMCRSANLIFNMAYKQLDIYILTGRLFGFVDLDLSDFFR